MKFIIRLIRISDEEIRNTLVAPLPGAYLRKGWREEWQTKLYSEKPKAVLDAHGAAQLVFERIAKPRDEAWYQYGRNHTEDDKRYYREVPDDNWMIVVDTLEQLAELLKDDWSEVSFSKNKSGEAVGYIKMHA